VREEIGLCSLPGVGHILQKSRNNITRLAPQLNP